MDTLNRRTLLKLLGSAPMAAGFVWTEAEAQQAHHQAQTARQTARKTAAAFKPKFFTPHEYATVRLLVDLIIPRDERSGSATEAGVPEFMDFMMIDQPTRQLAMRGGLAWLDLESQKRYDKRFIDCADGERTGLLDDIAALPARPELSHGAAFFTSFRDLTATGFWTSKLGMDDLQFMGNRYVATWNGCPDAALKKLGVSYPPA
jgi:gluconate 2-dehydrogenase gamma chain